MQQRAGTTEHRCLFFSVWIPSRYPVDWLAETFSRIFQSYAAIDDELDTRDIAALIACKIERAIGHIPGIAPEAHGNLPAASPADFSTIGVSIRPGRMAFTRILFGAY